MSRSWLLLIVCLLHGANGDDSTHKYEDGEEVFVWTNKVGPYHNPQETYDYYSLPFCQPTQKAIKKKSDSLGTIIEGTDLTDSGILMHFKVPQPLTKLCELTISSEDEAVLVDAVKNHYWYQMYVDELPVWGMVGEYMLAEYDANDKAHSHPKEQGFIYTHKDYSISYNGNQIIQVNLTSENPMPINVGEKHAITFSVTWVKTEKSFDTRYHRYYDFDFFEHQIHWFSIFNSFMMVVFLVGLVALILMRTLKNDYARFTSDDDDLELDRVVDESGWKQVHGDVFRPPPRLMLYAAIVGNGHQLFVLGFFVISLVLMFSLYHHRGSMVTTAIIFYSLTSFVAGYSSSSTYKRNGGEDWKPAMVLTAGLVPLVAGAICMSLNLIAMFYGSTAITSVSTIMIMSAIWLFVSCPLVLLGTIVGRSMAVVGDFPCRVNTLMRPIPDGRWYTRPITLILFSGILPFGSIFIEMYFVFTSFWNYKFYYVYGFMLLVYLILIVVTVCVTIVSTYFLLNAEDYRWQWTSLLSAGSTSIYVYLYSIYYFFTKTRMSGILQTFFYFGYMGVFCFLLFILCATIGHMGTRMFIHKIYQYIKSD